MYIKTIRASHDSVRTLHRKKRKVYKSFNFIVESGVKALITHTHFYIKGFAFYMMFVFGQRFYILIKREKRSI